MNKRPKLRFPEFNDEYSDYDLNDIAVKIIEKNINFKVKKVISNSSIFGLISQRDYFDKDIANDVNIDGYYIIKKGDFVYNPRKSKESPYGPINMYCFNELGIVSPLYLCFRIFDEKVNKNYLKYYFKSDSWYKFIYLNSDQGVRHDRVSIKDGDFFKLKLTLPEILEQDKVVNFLNTYDTRIKKQQDKISQLEDYKKGLMQRIYSQEIKFKGKNDAHYPEWEEKNLREVTYAFDYGMNAPAKVYDGENKYIRITDIDDNSNKYISDSVVSPDIPLDDKYLLSSNDLLFARTGASTGKTYLYDSADGKVYFAGFLIRGKIKSDYNAKFLFYATKILRYRKWVEVMSMRSGQPGINAQEYAKYSLLIPTFAEQTKIANFLSKYDEKIEMEKEKLKLMKEYKKGLLQQMFV